MYLLFTDNGPSRPTEENVEDEIRTLLAKYSAQSGGAVDVRQSSAKGKHHQTFYQN